MALMTCGDLIVERLKRCCPSVGNDVFSTADLVGVKEKTQVVPALHVVLHSYEPKSDDTGGTSRWEETYLVVAVVKNARQHVGVEAIRSAGAAILAEVMAALDGWKCPQAAGVVRAATPPRPLFTDNHGYLPLAFRVTVLTDGVPDDY